MLQAGNDIKQRAMVKSMLNTVEVRPPSIVEIHAIMKQWFKASQNENGLVTRSALAKKFVELGIARDYETASTMIEASMEGAADERLVMQLDLEKMLMRTAFRTCLLEMFSKIQETSKHLGENISLKTKISNYKRKIKMQGVQKLPPTTIHGGSIDDFIEQDLQESQRKAG